MNDTVRIGHGDYEPVKMLIVRAVSLDDSCHEMLTYKGGDWLARVLSGDHYYAFSIFAVDVVVGYFDNIDAIVALAFADALNINVPFRLSTTQMP